MRLSLRDLPREVGALSAVAVVVALGFGILAPALPVFARQFGVSNTAASAVISAFAFSRLAFGLGAGRLVDRLGERRVLASGIAIVAVSSLLAGLANTYWQLLVLRGIGGVGSVMFSVSAASLLLRVVDPGQRGRALGVWTGGFLVGTIVGPAVGGAVIGVSIRAPFFLYTATLVVAGAIALITLRHTELRDRDNRDTAGRTTLGQAARSPAYRAAVSTHLADAWAVLGVRVAIVPLFVTGSLGLDAVWIGVGFAIVAGLNAVLLVPAGAYVDSHGRRRLILVGLTVCAAGMAVLAAAPTLPGYLTGMVLLGLGAGVLNIAPGAMMGDVVGRGGGSPVAVYQMAADVGSITGPLVAGLLADHYGFSAAFGASVGVLGVALVLALLAPETHRVSGEVAASGGVAVLSEPSAHREAGSDRATQRADPQR